MDLNRRTLLRSAAVAVAAGLAGCTDGGTPTDGQEPGDGGGADDTTPTPTESGGMGDATPTEGADDTPTATATPDATPRADPTVTVAPDGKLRFRPASFEITPGTEVTWVWEGSGHNIVVGAQPDGASWGGTEGGEGTTYDEGHEHSHTFETPGTYDYYCAPHEQFGMTASLTVVEE